MADPKAIGFVFARGGSKGVPRKNLRHIAGKPLIAHAIEAALASRYIDTVVVSTDDDEIAQTARQFGAITPFMRPAELAADNALEWHAWQHAIMAIQEMPSAPLFEVFVSVPPTAPLREPQDIDLCIEGLMESQAGLAITVYPSGRSPYFNQVVLDDNHLARVVFPPPKEGYFGRQGAPQVFDMATVAYAARPQYVLEAQYLWDGQVTAVQIPVERALDIDTEHDLLMARLLMEHRRGERL